MATGRGPMFKVVLLGEVGVGKTSLFFRLRDNSYNPNFIKTATGIDSCTKIVTVGGVQVTFSVWDTAGVERFRTLTRNYYRNAHITVLLYSLDDPTSLHFLPKWIDDTNDFAPNALKVLVGNKTDLTSQIPHENAQDFASIYNCDLMFRMSVKTGDGVEEAFKCIAEKMLDAMKSKQTDGEIFTKTILSNRNQKQNSDGCGC